MTKAPAVMDMCIGAIVIINPHGVLLSSRDADAPCHGNIDNTRCGLITRVD